MERLLAEMSEDPLAALAGLAGIACLAIWPLFRARSTMLAVLIGNNLAFAAHYGLLEDWTAVAMNGLMAIQSVVAIWLVRLPRLRWVYFGTIPLLAVASIATWYGIPSLLAAVATTLSTAGRLQGNDLVLRLLLLSSTPFWMAHDLMVGSFPGLIADLVSMTIGAAMVLRRSGGRRIGRAGGEALVLGAEAARRGPGRAAEGESCSQEVRGHHAGRYRPVERRHGGKRVRQAFAHALASSRGVTMSPSLSQSCPGPSIEGWGVSLMLSDGLGFRLWYP
jgi:hypothetical protein